MLTALVLKEFRLLRRDLHGLAVLLVMPTLFILIMSLAMQDAFDREGRPRIVVGVESMDRGSYGAEVIATLASQSGMALVSIAEKHDIALQLPEDFSERLFESPDDLSTPLLTWSSAPTVPGQVRSGFSAALTGALLRTQGEVLIRTIEVEQNTDLTRLREIMDPQRWHVQTLGGPGQRELPNAVQQNVPAWLVFAMFFVVVPLSTVMLAERDHGTAIRLRALNVSPLLLLLARVLPYYLVNMLQMVAMLMVGIWLVPVLGGEGLNLGSSLTGLWLIGSATSLAAIGLALLVATLAKSAIQAIALGGAINLVLAAIGGIMVPKMIMPPVMQSVASWSPLSWALEGFWEVLLRGGDAMAPMPDVAALIILGGAAIVLAAWLQGRND